MDEILKGLSLMAISEDDLVSEEIFNSLHGSSGQIEWEDIEHAVRTNDESRANSTL